MEPLHEWGLTLLQHRRRRCRGNWGSGIAGRRRGGGAISREVGGRDGVRLVVGRRAEQGRLFLVVSPHGIGGQSQEGGDRSYGGHHGSHRGVRMEVKRTLSPCCVVLWEVWLLDCGRVGCGRVLSDCWCSCWGSDASRALNGMINQ